MTIYRGYEIKQDADGTYSWVDDAGNSHGRHKTEDSAMDDVDKYRRQKRTANAD